MARKREDRDESASLRVNVEIAPGNRSRLEAFMLANRSDPDRSRPVLTLTDILNEALDEFFSVELAELGSRTADRAQPAGTAEQSKGRTKR